MILGLFTQLRGSGGVQRLSRHVAAVIADLSLREGVPYRILSLLDPSGHGELIVGAHKLDFHGFGRNLVGFVATALMSCPSLVVIGHVQLAPIGTWISHFGRNPKFVLLAYGIEVWNRRSYLARLAGRVDFTLCVSKFTAEAIARNYGVPLSKTSVVYPCVDPDLSRDAALNEDDPRNERTILTVARLARTERYKGVRHVIKALPFIMSTVPNVRYTIVGKGNDETSLLRLARSLGVESAVDIVGEVTDSQLGELYRQCDVLAMPSLQEGLGIVFLEAMAYAKPVIAGNHGGSPEVVLDGNTGFLVDYGDVEALAARLVRLLRDESLRRRMGELGRLRAIHEFSFRNFSQNVEKVLVSLRSEAYQIRNDPPRLNAPSPFKPRSNNRGDLSWMR